MSTHESTAERNLHFELDDTGVAVLTINRPDRRNAIDRATAQAIADALDRVDEDDAIRVAVITGAGGTFSAGMDLKEYFRETEALGLAGIRKSQREAYGWWRGLRS